MEKVTTKQLLDIAVEIVGKADKCYRAGLIDDWQAEFKVQGENDYSFEVRVNPFMLSEKVWTAKAKTYVVNEPDTPEPNLEEAQALKEHLDTLIEQARAEIQNKLNILNA